MVGPVADRIPCRLPGRTPAVCDTLAVGLPATVVAGISPAVAAPQQQGARWTSTERGVTMPYPRSTFDEGIRSADGLARHLRGGGALVAVSSGVRLEPGEAEHAQVWVDARRYHPLDGVAPDQLSVFALGSFTRLAAGAIGSTVVNARRRRKVERRAAPQWRALGPVGVTVTSRRLLVLRQMSWSSIWFDQIIQVVPAHSAFVLDLVFDGSPPFRFSGPSVPFVAVMLVYLLSGEVLSLPGTDLPGNSPPAPTELTP